MIQPVHPNHDSEPPTPGAHRRIPLADATATEALGGQLAAGLRPGLVIYLQGDLGAGKTTMARGMLRALGHAGKVKSPTYTLIEPYALSRLDLYHFDFYRFEFPEEYLEAGLDEYFSGHGDCLVEWPDRAAPHVPPPDLVIQLDPAGDEREATLDARTEAGRSCLTTLPPLPAPPAANS